MSSPTRLYNFVPEGLIESAKLNAELNQLITALGHIETDGTLTEAIINTLGNSDIRLHATGVKTLSLDDNAGGELTNFVVLSPVDIRRNGSSLTALSVRPVLAGTYNALQIDSSGKIEAGNTSAAVDTNLYRVSANRWKTDDSFEVDLNLIVGGIAQGSSRAFGAHLSSNQAIPNTTWTKVAFDTKDYDYGTTHDSSEVFNTTNNRITPGQTGAYHIDAFIRFITPYTTNTGVAYLAIYKNGALYKQSFVTNVNLNDDIHLGISCDVLTDADDYFEIFVYRNNGVDTLDSAATFTHLSGHKVGFSY